MYPDNSNTDCVNEPFYANQEEDPKVQQYMFEFWQAVDNDNLPFV